MLNFPFLSLFALQRDLLLSWNAGSKQVEVLNKWPLFYRCFYSVFFLYLFSVFMYLFILKRVFEVMHTNQIRRDKEKTKKKSRS